MWISGSFICYIFNNSSSVSKLQCILIFLSTFYYFHRTHSTIIPFFHSHSLSPSREQRNHIMSWCWMFIVRYRNYNSPLVEVVPHSIFVFHYFTSLPFLHQTLFFKYYSPGGSFFHLVHFFHQIFCILYKLYKFEFGEAIVCISSIFSVCYY